MHYCSYFPPFFLKKQCAGSTLYQRALDSKQSSQDEVRYWDITFHVYTLSFHKDPLKYTVVITYKLNVNCFCIEH